MMQSMPALPTFYARTVARRLLAVLLALGVAALPLLPQPRLHVCHMGGAMAMAMSMSMATAPAPEADCCCPLDGHHDQRAPAKPSCCQELALDQHQPSAPPAPAPADASARDLPAALVVAVLPHSARHGLLHAGAACTAPYPDGPPAYLSWGGFLI